MKCKFLFFCVAFFAICLALSVQANAQTLTVTNDYANCRSRAGASNEYLGRVYAGESYDIKGEAKAPNGKLWYKINKGGRDCYICSSFVRVNPARELKSANSTRASVKRELGVYYITGYCAACNTPKNSRATASGKTATVGRTVAMKGLPFGTRIYIDSIGERIVEDRGVGAGKIDVFCACCADERKITGKRKVWILE